MAIQDKVSVLGVNNRAWGEMNVQQQMLFVTQQLINYMASGLYDEMEGLAIHVIDPALGPTRPRVIFQIGKEAKISPIIGAN